MAVGKQSVCRNVASNVNSAHISNQTPKYSTPIADSGCTHTLVRQSDAATLTTAIQQHGANHDITVANGSSIHPIGTAQLITGNPALQIPALICRDTDLSRSLIALADYTAAGCTISLTDTEIVVSLQGICVARGIKTSDDKLWPFPTTTIYPVLQLEDPDSFAGHIVTHQYQADYVRFMHAALGSPPISTLLRAISAGYLRYLPRLTSDVVRANPPVSMATAKGHLQQTRRNLRSTQSINSHAAVATTTDASAPPVDALIENTDTEPADEFTDLSRYDEEDTILSQIIHGSGYSDINHSDMPGAVPFRSLHGNIYHHVSVFNNYIHVEPMASRTATDHVKALSKTLAFFRKCGHQPKVQRMDNETSNLMKTFLETNDLTASYVPPSTHRRNRAERAIQAWKNHFISINSTVHPSCPASAWEEFLGQAELTLNHLRPFGPDPKKSAYDGIHGHQHDFHGHPIAPCGTKVLIYETPAARAAWAAHGVPGFYTGPAMQGHYRCYNVLVASTLAMRVSDSLAWFPEPFHMPGSSKDEIFQAAISQLATACSHIVPQHSTADDPQRQRTVSTLTDALQAFRQMYSNSEPLEASLPLAPPTGTEQRVPPVVAPLQTVVIPATPQEQRVSLPEASPPIPVSPSILHDQRVAPLSTAEVSDSPPADVTTQPCPAAATPAAPVSEPTAGAPLPPPTNVADTAPQQSTGPRDVRPKPRAVRLPAPPRTTNTRSVTQAARSTDIDPPNRTYKEHQHVTGKAHIPTVATIPVPVSQRMRRTPERYAAVATAPCPVIAPMSASTIASPASQECPQVPSSTDPFPEPCINILADPSNYSRALKTVEAPHWEQAASEEFARLFTETQTMKPIMRNAVPAGRTISFYNPQCKTKIKDGKLTYRVRGTYGGNITDYTGKTTALTADMTTVKMFLNAAISEDAEFMTADIKDFYLHSTLERPEYMRIASKCIPAATQEKFELDPYLNQDHMVVEITKGIYGLKQAGLLAQRRLVKHLALHGYHQTDTTPCLFHHDTRPISFVLIVDDFGIKHHGSEHAQHLIDTLQLLYTLKVNWKGDRFIGFSINYDRPQRKVTLSMPGYVQKVLLQFDVVPSACAVHTPDLFTPIQYGSRRHLTTVDASALLSPEKTKTIQQIVGSMLYYARAVDSTMLVAIGRIASQQSKATETTWNAAQRLLQYAAAYPNAQLVYHASDMVLHVQSDASFNTEPKARSRAGGLHYLGNSSTDSATVVNGATHAMSMIIPVVVTSAPEAEYAALFCNGQQVEIERTILADLGYPQPPTGIKTDNEVAENIANDSCNERKSKTWDVRFHWIRDRVAQLHFHVFWGPGYANLADFLTKSHPTTHFVATRRFFVEDLDPIPPKDTAAHRRRLRNQDQQPSLSPTTTINAA